MLKGSESGSKTFSRPIVSIAIAGIALGMAVMILSMAIVTGFKTEVRNKVTGFGAHIQITPLSMNNSYESERMQRQAHLTPEISALREVRHVQSYATKPGIVETETDIHGVIAKGIGTDFDWHFFRDKLVLGALPNISDTAITQEVLVSTHLANLLKLDTNQRITVYFANQAGSLSPRRFVISGMYETGLAEFDAQFLFMDIGHLQRINRWGLEAQLRVTGDCENQLLIVEALAFGGDGEYRFNWGDAGMRGAGPHGICIDRDTTLKVVLTDRSLTLPDSAWMTVQYPEDHSGCICDTDLVQVQTGGGSNHHYVGGYEVVLHDFRHMHQANNAVYDILDYDLKTTLISERIPEIFNWLEMIDINPKIIITLMIIVAVINMSSALLILILERVNMIGILKALGATDWSVRKIFLYTAAYLIGYGLLIGNVVGIGLCLAQEYWELVSLDPASYYVSSVPILLKWEHVLMLNIGTLAICLLVLILPSYLVTRISPVRAIRFD